ncbi:MAG: hypothetical protein M1829_002081 [Trizodia sp. TS-e1964]|nr:MAG: hypothetical protein M1829_002081 [Trizodia sp. TS-e1964]
MRCIQIVLASSLALLCAALPANPPQHPAARTQVAATPTALEFHRPRAPQPGQRLARRATAADDDNDATYLATHISGNDPAFADHLQSLQRLLGKAAVQAAAKQMFSFAANRQRNVRTGDDFNAPFLALAYSAPLIEMPSESALFYKQHFLLLRLEESWVRAVPSFHAIARSLTLRFEAMQKEERFVTTFEREFFGSRIAAGMMGEAVVLGLVNNVREFISLTRDAPYSVHMPRYMALKVGSEWWYSAVLKAVVESGICEKFPSN